MVLQGRRPRTIKSRKRIICGSAAPIRLSTPPAMLLATLFLSPDACTGVAHDAGPCGRGGGVARRLQGTHSPEPLVSSARGAVRPCMGLDPSGIRTHGGWRNDRRCCAPLLLWWACLSSHGVVT